MNYSKKSILLSIIFVLLALFSSGPAFSQKNDQVVLIHVKNLKTEKELTLQAIVATSLAALNQSNRVVIFFDAGAVKAIKIGRWYGGDTTILDKVDIKGEQHKKLSGELNISQASTPSNYGDLFRLLRGKGIALYVSKPIIEELELDDEHYDTAFDPIDYEKIMEMISSADVYLSY
jgi:hypothetical protein